MSRPASIVISDWLANVRVGQMTPFEAAHSLMNYLQDEGYYVMKPSDAIEAAKVAARSPQESKSE